MATLTNVMSTGLLKKPTPFVLPSSKVQPAKTTQTTATATPATQTKQPVATPTPLKTPTPAAQLKPATPVQLPTPQAPGANLAYQQTVQGSVDTARKTLDTKLAEDKKRVDDEITKLRENQKKTLEEAKPLTEPFREELEKKERERLFVEDNFSANQRLTNELDTLLSEGNALIAQQKGLPMNQRAVALKTQRTAQDINARIGVIEAVMSARNNQISQAYTMIDRSVANIVADRTDSLNYYNTLLDLDSAQIISLDKESKDIATEQLTLVKGDLDRAEKTADYIKGLMVDPETAQFMADAGVTLTDTVEQIQGKMAEQGKRQEIIDAKNKLVEAGYEIVPYEAEGTMPMQVGGQTVYAKVRAGSPLDISNKMDSLDLQIKKAQLNKLTAPETTGIDWGQRANILKMASEGDPLAIASLGYDPRTKGLSPEKILESERNQAEGVSSISMIDKMLGNSRGIGAITGQVKSPSLSGFFMGGKSDGSALSLISKIPVIGNIQGAIQSRNDRDEILSDLQNLYNTEGFKEFIGLKQSGLTFGSLTEGERQAIFSAANRLNSALVMKTDASGLPTGRIEGYQGTADNLRNDLLSVQKGIKARNEEIATRLYLDPTEMQEIINL